MIKSSDFMCNEIAIIPWITHPGIMKLIDVACTKKVATDCNLAKIATQITSLTGDTPSIPHHLKQSLTKIQNACGTPPTIDLGPIQRELIAVEIARLTAKQTKLQAIRDSIRDNLSAQLATILSTASSTPRPGHESWSDEEHSPMFSRLFERLCTPIALDFAVKAAADKAKKEKARQQVAKAKARQASKTRGLQTSDARGHVERHLY
ncbi:hypothetical protein SeMB42_g05471 [Synchytrium endobioticum]|uniref:Uncharacterized protein n=1 Tax=Synchytrium endobioticum TaxID=286115 RepID=A0A507CR87_9FUNG|nr:hypothetical protein SeMB42_g05471 [Synchytrium endobioticum]TPX46280.1 hypothetical protein SeLEV6574_g03313 [Synchytrium endobioticum]